MNKLKNVAIGALAGAAVLALTSCGTSGKGGASSGSGEIVFRTFDPPAEASGLQGALDLWNESHKIQATLETVAVQDALAKYTREVNAGGGPDVSQQAFTWVRDLAESDLVADLGEHIDSAPPADGIDNFIGLDMAKRNGSVYGIPWSIDTFALAYNPKVLQAAGVSEIPTTWDGLHDVAKKLASPDVGGFCFGASSAPVSEIWHLLNYYLWSHDTPLIEKDGGSWKMGATTSDLASAFTYFNTFFTSGATPKGLISVDNAGDPAINNALADGKCGIAFMSPAQFRVALKSNPDLLTAPVPVGTSGETTTHLGGRSLVIGPNTKHPKAAWDLLKFLASKKVFEKYYTKQFPAQQSLLKTIDYGPAMKGYIDELPTAKTYLTYVESPSPTSKYWNDTAQIMGAVFSGQKTPDAAAKEFATTVDGLLKK